MKVEVSAEAEAQIGRIDAWWREHRPSAPDLFATELQAAFQILAEAPSAAVPYPPWPGVRRLLLRRTGHHLYVAETPGAVVVIAVWSAFRGRGPLP